MRCCAGCCDFCDNQSNLPSDTLPHLEPEDYFPHDIFGAQTLVKLQGETERENMKDGIIKSVQGFDMKLMHAQWASSQIGRTIDSSINILRSQLDVAEKAKNMLAVADKALNEMESLKNAHRLDPAEYTEDVITVLANKIDFTNDTMRSFKKVTGFHSLEEVQKVKDRMVLIKFLSLASQHRFDKNKEFEDNMDELKDSGVFWRANFPVRRVLHSVKFNLLTSQWLVAMYVQASGYRDFPTNTKFETQNITGVSPWTSGQPTRYVPASPIPSAAPTSYVPTSPIRSAMHSPSTSTLNLSSPKGANGGDMQPTPPFSHGSGFKNGRPPLRPTTVNYQPPFPAPVGPMPPAAGAATSTISNMEIHQNSPFGT